MQRDDTRRREQRTTATAAAAAAAAAAAKEGVRETTKTSLPPPVLPASLFPLPLTPAVASPAAAGATPAAAAAAAEEEEIVMQDAPPLATAPVNDGRIVSAPSSARGWQLPVAPPLRQEELTATLRPPVLVEEEAASTAGSSRGKRGNGNGGDEASPRAKKKQRRGSVSSVTSAASAASSTSSSPSFGSPEAAAQPAVADEEEQARQAAQQRVNHWLLLAAYGAIKQLRLSREQQQDVKLPFDAPAYTLSALLRPLQAQVDHQDAQGFSAIHWLVFDALESARPAPAAPSASEDEQGGKQPWSFDHLWRCSGAQERLDLLLRESEGAGYTYTWREDEAVELPQIKRQEHGPPKCTSLIDLRDAEGNTPLHWAVAWQRVDVVGLLLAHGARADIANKEGMTPDQMVSWDRRKVEDAAGSDGGAGSAAAAAASPGSGRSSWRGEFPPEIYCAEGHLEERRWGLPDGLRVEQCSFARGADVESDAAAIKRLLFQQRLFFAVDADPYGDESAVRALVAEWKKAEADGARMYPLAYRFDVCFVDPLQVAVAYEEPNDAIVELLLSLPQCWHVQSRAVRRAALHEAAALARIEPTDPKGGGKAYLQLLLDAGWQVNHRDVATGSTPLAVVCDLDPPRPHTKAVRAKHHERMLATAKFLTARGADPRIGTEGAANDCITLCLYNSFNLPLLRHLLDTQKADTTWLRGTVNALGNSLMHYALYHTFAAGSDHLPQLKMLLECGLAVDAPKNLAGLTPLQCWAGYESTQAYAVAQLMKVNMADVERLIVPERKRVPLRVIEANVTPGEATPTSVWSSFERQPDQPSVNPPFLYSPRHHVTPFAERFIKSLQPSAEEEHLHRLVWQTESLQSHQSIPVSYFEVRETERKGLGLFARLPIGLHRPGGAGGVDDEWGIEVCGELVSATEGMEREMQYQKQGHAGYCIHKLFDEFGHVLMIDTMHHGNLSRFVNSSCEPNFQLYQVSSGRRCMLFPNKTIRPGDEITIDYGLTLERMPRGVMLCHCGAMACKRCLI